MNQLDDGAARRKRHRRQRRLIAILGFLVFVTGMAWFFESQSTTTVIVLRYPEPEAEQLPTAGARNAALARTIATIDVVNGVDAIYAAPVEAAQKMAQPISLASEAPVYSMYDPSDVEPLARAVIEDFKGKIVLIITEPDQVAPTIRELHGSKKISEATASELDNLFIVSIPWFGKVKTLQLKYGSPTVDSFNMP